MVPGGLNCFDIWTNSENFIYRWRPGFCFWRLVRGSRRRKSGLDAERALEWVMNVGHVARWQSCVDAESRSIRPQGHRKFTHKAENELEKQNHNSTQLHALWCWSSLNKNEPLQPLLTRPCPGSCILAAPVLWLLMLPVETQECNFLQFSLSSFAFTPSAPSDCSGLQQKGSAPLA